MEILAAKIAGTLAAQEDVEKIILNLLINVSLHYLINDIFMYLIRKYN